MRVVKMTDPSKQKQRKSKYEIEESKKDYPVMNGAKIVLQALIDQGVDTIFGYPGGAVLPLYDELFQQEKIKHVLVRHEQAAVHAAEGYARSTGKVGCVLVTSGPGATNAVTGLTDALLDSIPVVCITGQVPTFLIGYDAFQEADTTGITRPCTKHNYLVNDVNKLSDVVHEAFHVARTGRPGPVVIDIPKDVQFQDGPYKKPKDKRFRTYQPASKPDPRAIEEAVKLIANAKRPIFYTGGGVINAGPEACEKLTEFVKMTGYPITSTLMGLGCYPTTDEQFVGMLGMHGTFEANNAMYDCDVMINIGARFDDRVTGLTSAFSPNSKKIHVDIDPSSINKNITVELPIVADAGQAIDAMMKEWKKQNCKPNEKELGKWWKEIEKWRSINCLQYKQDSKIIKPQYALERLRDLSKDIEELYITTEVGQHQMWAAQFLPFNKPNRWMTSGGLGTMGYGFPAALGVQIAHPNATVIDVAGEASIQMNIQELSTAIQHRLPVKIFILNNEWMGMVRQWQELLHGERYSHSYTDSLPDFVKLAEAYGGMGLRADTTDELDDVIKKMLTSDVVTIADIRVDPKENCFPMIPSGKAHNEMILSPEAEKFEQGLV